jgi:hypothetical protein
MREGVGILLLDIGPEAVSLVHTGIKPTPVGKGDRFFLCAGGQGWFFLEILANLRGMRCNRRVAEAAERTDEDLLFKSGTLRQAGRQSIN